MKIEKIGPLPSGNVMIEFSGLDFGDMDRAGYAVGTNAEVTLFTEHGAAVGTKKAIDDELRRAMTKFPLWPVDVLHAVGIVNEEVGELNRAILQQVYEPHKNKPGAVRAEAIQSAAMLLRFLDALDRYEYAPSVEIEQSFDEVTK